MVRVMGSKEMCDLLSMKQRFIVGAVLALVAIILVAPHRSAIAQLRSCQMSASQIAAVAALPDPIRRNAAGAYVRGGKMMDEESVLDMCLTRHMYDMVVAREAAGQKVRVDQMTLYEPAYLTVSECVRVSNSLEQALYRTDISAKGREECQRSAGHP
jgi:hypothetical protein